MKKFSLIFGALLTLFFISCEGPQGPPGFDGFDGPQGPQGIPGEEALVFEVDNVDFEYFPSSNLYSTIINFNALLNDAILVYRFDGVAEFDDGSSENLWSLIPQSFFLDGGTIQYTNSHSSRDVEIFIDANFDISTLDIGFTQDQIFRIVILPGQAATSKMDTSSITSVMATLGVTEADIQKITLD